jgi:hypothetical protein
MVGSINPFPGLLQTHHIYFIDNAPFFGYKFELDNVMPTRPLLTTSYASTLHTVNFDLETLKYVLLFYNHGMSIQKLKFFREQYL